MSSGFVSYSCHFFRTRQTCTCGGYTSCACRRAHACSSRTVFFTVSVGRGRCADPPDRRRGYARPAVGRRPRSRENMVVVNADALVRLTRAVLPAISPTPLRYRLPLWSSTTATAIADRPARANSTAKLRAEIQVTCHIAAVRASRIVRKDGHPPAAGGCEGQLTPFAR